MPKVRDLLGHVSVEIGKHQRKCHRSRRKHGIPAGTAHLAVKGGSFGARKNYCPDCAKPILDALKRRLQEIKEQLAS